MKMKAVLGGTFSSLHIGHKALIEEAFRVADEVIIGLTTDSYLKLHKYYSAPRYSYRKARLENYLRKFSGSYRIEPLDSKYGKTLSGTNYDFIVVSDETRKTALEINEKREEAGLKSMKVVSVPIVLAEDLFPLSSTRILSHEVRPNGKRITPIRIGIATRNDLKVVGATVFFRTIMRNLQVEKAVNYSLDTDQPLGDDTQRMALKRAEKALENRDYGIGVESGVYRDPVTGKYFDFHCCVALDRFSRSTVGFSSGFEIPGSLIDQIKRGHDESEAYGLIYGKSDIGKSSGIVGELSRGKLAREQLITESVRNAFIPRLGSFFFGSDSKSIVR